ncbi:hypothetical protein [Cerasicoccus frondis]|nr:hypothetical protein [Cerasicoccus frondis]
MNPIYSTNAGLDFGSRGQETLVPTASRFPFEVSPTVMSVGKFTYF